MLIEIQSEPKYISLNDIPNGGYGIVKKWVNGRSGGIIEKLIHRVGDTFFAISDGGYKDWYLDRKGCTGPAYNNIDEITILPVKIDKIIVSVI